MPPVRAGRGASASTTSGSILLSLGGVALITILFIFPLYKAGLPRESDFSWEPDERHGCCGSRLSESSSGAGGSCRRTGQGPGPAGTDEELRGSRPVSTRVARREPGTWPPSGSSVAAVGVRGAGDAPRCSHHRRGRRWRSAAADQQDGRATSAETPPPRKAAVYSPVCVRESGRRPTPPSQRRAGARRRSTRRPRPPAGRSAPSPARRSAAPSPPSRAGDDDEGEHRRMCGVEGERAGSSDSPRRA